MIPEIGHYALILALCVAVVQGILPIYGAAVRNSVVDGRCEAGCAWTISPGACSRFAA